MKIKKSVIIFLHGWGESKKMWNSILPSFTRDHTVYALDLLGFGDNQKRYTVFSLEDYIGQLHDFFRIHNIKHAILVGHSFGGRVATLFAIRHPEKVDKLILYSSSIPLYNQHPNTIRNFINKNLIILFSLVTRGCKNKKLSLHDYMQLRETYKNTGSKTHFHKKLPLIKHPVLLMAGRFDFLATLPHQENLLKHFINAKLVIFNRSTHIACRREK